MIKECREFIGCDHFSKSLCMKVYPVEVIGVNCVIYSHFSSEGSQTSPVGAESQSAATEPSGTSSPPSPPSSSSAFCPVLPSRQIVERQPRMLNFRVEYRTRSVDVVLEDTSTVGECGNVHARTQNVVFKCCIYLSIYLISFAHTQLIAECNKAVLR